MSFWEEKRVLVTGGAGFIGSHLVEYLLRQNAVIRVADDLSRGHLNNLSPFTDKLEFQRTDLSIAEDCVRVSEDIDLIMHLASKVAGIEYNVEHPGTMFSQNALMSIQILEAARRLDVPRLLIASSACVYPRFSTIPTPEEEGMEGHPEVTNEGYGWAKRMAEFQAQAYAKEFGMKIAIVRPYNCYGPRDHFEPETSHVIPALIRRVVQGEDPLVVWGTGKQTRSFIYVADVVRGMALAAERYARADPINIGSSEEVSIGDLVGLILDHVKLRPEIVFDRSKPSGQPRRICDGKKAKQFLGFEADVDLQSGLRRTIEWYLAGGGGGADYHA